MKLKQICDNTSGASLVEFTVTLPLFLLLTFGLLQAGLLLYTQSGLQHGVEAAARCASVNYSANQLGLTQSCFTDAPAAWFATAPTPSGVVGTPSNYVPSYAAHNSWGINPSAATFTVTGGSATTNTCGTTPGYLVSATYTYNVMSYLFHPTLTAQSCFPIFAG
jgi:Flp pilus assembly protein TadG